MRGKKHVSNKVRAGSGEKGNQEWSQGVEIKAIKDKPDAAEGLVMGGVLAAPLPLWSRTVTGCDKLSVWNF